ncbi:MAG TPA: hypothetical protein VKQ54_12555 [Caulobacteraceae bacterium]|nr:hypothetical protein [Caulobacteraceae bacterium]
MKTLVMGLAGLAILAAPLAASAEPYGHGRDGGGWSHESRGYGRGYDRGYDRDGGAAIVAGVAGLALGAALSDRGDYGYAPDYGYGYAPAYGYAPRCFWQNQPYRTYYGVAYRQVEVCR